MTAKTSEGVGMSVPLCIYNRPSQTNGTCIDQMEHFFPPFSSTFALIVLVAMMVGIIFLSLATFHLHKRRMRKRKIQRAQEEYERDSRSPVSAKGKMRDTGRPCIIVRPVAPRDIGHQSLSTDVQKCDQDTGLQSLSTDVQKCDQDTSCEIEVPGDLLSTDVQKCDQDTSCEIEVPGDLPTAQSAEKWDTTTPPHIGQGEGQLES